MTPFCWLFNCPVLEGDPDLAGFVIGYIEEQVMYGKTCVKRPLSKRPKLGLQDQLSLNARQQYQGGRRSGRTASAGPLFWTSMLSAVSLFSFWLIFLCAYL